MLLFFFLETDIVEVNSIKHSSSNVAIDTIGCEVILLIIIIHLFIYLIFWPRQSCKENFTPVKLEWNDTICYFQKD